MKGHIGGSVTKGKTYSGRIGNFGLRGYKILYLQMLDFMRQEMG